MRLLTVITYAHSNDAEAETRLLFDKGVLYTGERQERQLEV